MDEKIIEEPSNEEKILEADISTAIQTHNQEKKGEIEKQLFRFRCEKYSDVKNNLMISNEKLKLDTKDINEQIRVLQEAKDKIYNERYKPILEVFNSENTRLKDKIVETFPDEKTVKFEGIGRFTKKILKSIEVVDKDKLLSALVEKKMLSKGVKSFDTNFLKKSKELDLFSDDEVKIIEKASLLFVEEKAKENNKL